MYERAAARYDEDRAQFTIPRDDTIDALLASRATVRVLDLGCGTGRWLEGQRAHFADSRVALLGADPSSAMLAEARAKGLPNLIQARAEDLPLSDGAVGCITCSYCFHHFVDKEQALDEVARVLTDDGVLRIHNIEPSSADGWWVYEHFPEAVALDTARFWTPSRTAEALEVRGFTVEIQLDTGSEQIPAAHALADAERRVISELALLDDEAYERGVNRLRRLAEVEGAVVTHTLSRLHLTARLAS